MYYPPLEYWDEESLIAIGNGLGEFIKAAEEIMLCRYTSYARICVYMKLGKELMDSISLLHDEFEWIQLIDYEHVPFRCRGCHAHGHLFRDCPLNAPPKPTENRGKSHAEGFAKLASGKKHAKKPPLAPKNATSSLDVPSSSNSFDIFANLDMPKLNPPATTKTTSAPSTKLSSTPIHNESSQPLEVNTSDLHGSTTQPIPNHVNKKAL